MLCFVLLLVIIIIVIVSLLLLFSLLLCYCLLFIDKTSKERTNLLLGDYGAFEEVRYMRLCCMVDGGYSGLRTNRVFRKNLRAGL